MSDLGRTLVFVGLGITVLGALLWLAATGAPWLRLGRLPGDIVIERDGFTLYVPLTTMILISLVLTAIVQLVRWLR